jgi:hypothetical protein
MNKVILLALLMPATAFGQIMETFESGNITPWHQNPEGHWNTDNTNVISGALSLHHTFDNADSGNDRIGLPLKNLHPDEGNVRWSFKIRYGADPSSTNSWVVYLMSDSDPASFSGNQPRNGFAVGVNQTGYDDTLRLWKIKEGIFSPVINSNINWQTSIGNVESATIDAERSSSGSWNLKISSLSGNLIDSSSGNDPDLFAPEWLIICYKYTSSRDRLLWLDDIIVEGIFHEDNTPPEILNCEISGKSSVNLTFSEEPCEASLLPHNFSILNSSNNVTDVTKLSSHTIKINFGNEFANRVLYTLAINNLCDKTNNCSFNVTRSFSAFTIMTGDVIISEIMADPVPSVNLPAEEYIEIFNRTGSEINLRSWTLVTETQDYPFPETVIDPGEYMIICSVRDTMLFSYSGTTSGFKTFPVLTDEGRLIAVRDSSGNFIHGVKYSSRWYGNELKAEGGWSLEIIDAEYPFYLEDNWLASASRDGGTPGKPNSVSRKNRDPGFYGITNVFPTDSINLILSFSETVTDAITNRERIKVDNTEIRKIEPVDPLLRKFSVELEEPLQKHKICTLKAGKEIMDFSGNQMETSSFSFGIPEPASVGNILFNELLFNPMPGESDFVEFYNSSGKVIDISRLILVSVNDATGDTSETCYLSEENRCLLPGNYFVITADRHLTIERYPSSGPENIFEISNLPSMSDDKGHLLLFTRELELIDEVYYDDDMHYSLLSGYEGISLERIRPQGSSTDRSLWHSASEPSGWGTPGIRNSVYSERSVTNDQVILSSSRITPDNDGNDDFLVIDLKLTGTGNIVSVSVFDETGGFVKKITDNLLAGPEASIIWNGTADDEKPVSNGIYILLISVFDDMGKTHKWKRVCTVIRQ